MKNMCVSAAFCSVSVTFSAALIGSTAFAYSYPSSMEVFGDSISASMLADTHTGIKLTADQTSRLFAAMSLQNTHVVGSLEYHLAFQKLGAAPSLSGFTGQKPWSHASLIEAKTGQRPKTRSLAISGATTETLLEQISRARENYATGTRPADYVVINIGSNDFCQDVTPETFRANFHFRLYQILKDHPRSVVVVVPLADIPEVLALDDRLAFEVMGRKVSCREISQEMGTCQGLGVVPGDRGVEYALASERRSVFNAIIDDEVDRQKSGRGSYAPYQGLMAVAKSVSEAALSNDMLAADCFHPSEAGQRAMAKATWQTAQELLFGH